MEEIKGVIKTGINNIYSVESDGVLYECRIKGKVLKTEKKYYNPIAAGDNVLFEIEEGQNGLITAIIDRKNTLERWNNKRNAPQIIASNFDVIVCVCSPVSPPFRPRFVDRVLVAAPENCEVLIVLNKVDQGLDEDVEDRLAEYQEMGYEVLLSSAETGEGVDELREFIEDRRAVFTGQSGVGKSSLLNVLRPDLNLKVGELSEKYNRGRHTTCYSILSDKKDDIEVIDTPGIREIEVFGIKAEDLQFYFKDFKNYIHECKFTGCTHVHEPKCAVKQAALDGEIHPDRYESYLRIFQSLKEIEGKYK
ncbi:MAG: ribosome small subunit-dependent GTPase A [Spirochaetales bacterium]|nr:ribosome small subunit-dependent GTPase A [Spirochaetales bacterium]